MQKILRFSRLLFAPSPLLSSPPPPPPPTPKQGELADKGRGIKPVTSVTAKREKGGEKKEGERVNIIFIQILIMSHEVLNEALASTPGSNGTCTVSYSGLLYHSTYMPISRAAVRKSDPDTSFLDASCLSTLYGVPVLRSRTRTNAANDIRHRYVSSHLLFFSFFFCSPLSLSLSLSLCAPSLSR